MDKTWTISDNAGGLIVGDLTLSSALEHAKKLDQFVTISDGDNEIVGMFGVNSIENNMCPDGIAYTWKKRRQ